MNERSQSSGGDQDELLAGQRLAAARKSKDISIFEIAKELHLDEHKVQALEENRFDVLGAPVFAKGHLRKYAQLVGVGVDDIMADYYTMHRATGAPPVVGAVRKPPREFSLGPWLIVVVAVAVAVAAYWFWPDGASSTSDDEPVESVPSTEEPSEPQLIEDAPANDEPPTESAPSENVDEAEPLPTAATPDPELLLPPVNVPAEDALRFSLTFSGDCWTEISDAAGERLFFGLGEAGRTVTLSGEAPVRVLFGDSDNVTLTVNGVDYPILPSMRRGRTARFTLTGQ